LITTIKACGGRSGSASFLAVGKKSNDFFQRFFPADKTTTTCLQVSGGSVDEFRKAGKVQLVSL